MFSIPTIVYKNTGSKPTTPSVDVSKPFHQKQIETAELVTALLESVSDCSQLRVTFLKTPPEAYSVYARIYRVEKFVRRQNRLLAIINGLGEESYQLELIVTRGLPPKSKTGKSVLVMKLDLDADATWLVESIFYLEPSSQDVHRANEEEEYNVDEEEEYSPPVEDKHPRKKSNTNQISLVSSEEAPDKSAVAATNKSAVTATVSQPKDSAEEGDVEMVDLKDLVIMQLIETYTETVKNELRQYWEKKIRDRMITEISGQYRIPEAKANIIDRVKKRISESVPK
jgi:hypothetical protein